MDNFRFRWTYLLEKTLQWMLNTRLDGLQETADIVVKETIPNNCSEVNTGFSVHIILYNCILIQRGHIFMFNDWVNFRMALETKEVSVQYKKKLVAKKKCIYMNCWTIDKCAFIFQGGSNCTNMLLDIITKCNEFTLQEIRILINHPTRGKHI
jgi:hypothetical protein